MNKTLQSWKQESRLGKLQLVCVLAVVVAELVFLSPKGLQSGIASVTVDYLLAIPALAFLMLCFARGFKGKGITTMVLSLVMLFWFGLVQGIRAYFDISTLEPGEMLCFYALALPLAYGMADGRRQWGLNALAALFLVEGIQVLLLTVGLYLEVLPDFCANVVRWAKGRLVQLYQPNNCGALLLVSIGVTFGLSFRTQKRWLRCLLIVLAALEFAVQTLTESRTNITFTCLLVGGILFCAIRGTGWKRALTGLAVGAVVVVVMFLASQKLYDLHLQYLNRETLQEAQEQAKQTDQNGAEAETQTPTEPVKTLQGRSFLKHMPTLNGRTGIWEASLRGVAHNPKILLCGADSVISVLAEEGSKGQHTHNSYLETLYTLGIPGLVMALILTVLAVRAALLLLWKNTDVWKSSVALITLCMLGCSLLEPFLFAAKYYHHYLSLFFLAAVGYLHQWCAESKE